MDSSVFTIEIDDLEYTYDDGNRLKKVTDNTNHPEGFTDGADNNEEYVYDLYGNMVSDENKEISQITYNHLNLPKEIKFSGTPTRKISYLYNALGQKVQKVITNGLEITTTDYLSGFHYENNGLKFFATAEGYVNVSLGIKKGSAAYSYVYNYTDHLGNIRLSYTSVFNLLTGNQELRILEENHYYPFGLKHKKYGSVNYDFVALEDDEGYYVGIDIVPPGIRKPYQYKYNSKEFQDELGLNFYDFGFRNYSPDLGRWFNMDAHSESYFQLSPYNYVRNNPINLIDLLGLDPIYRNGKYYDTIDGEEQEVSWNYVNNWIQKNDGIAVTYEFKTNKDGNARLINTSSKSKKNNSFIFNEKEYVANSYMTLMGRDDRNNDVGDFKNIVNLEMGLIYQVLGQAAYVFYDLYRNNVENAMLRESIGGRLDYKNVVYEMFGFNRRSLIQINGVVYNPNEAGNFLWGMVLEYYGGLISPNKVAELGTRGRPDERWEQKAITAGRKFGLQLYQNRNTSSQDLILMHRLNNRRE